MFRRSCKLIMFLLLSIAVLSSCATQQMAPTATGAPTSAPAEVTAEPQPEAQEPVLTVMGKPFTLADLQAFEQVDAEADGQQYTGARFVDVLEAAGVQGGELVMVAGDGYSASVPAAEINEDCLLAYNAGGGVDAVMPGLSKMVWVRSLVEVKAAGGASATAVPEQAKPTAAGGAPRTRTITDMMGQTVAIAEADQLQRVAVLTSPQVMVVYALGAQEKLCAVTNAVKMWPLLTQFDPRLAEVPAVRAQFAQINVEALLQANPDVCLGSSGDMEVVQKSTDLPALSVATNEPGRYYEYQKEEVAFFGQVLGAEERAEKYMSYLDRILADIQAGTSGLADGERVKVYLGFGPDHLVTYGGDTYMQEWIEAAGCDNAAEGISTIGGKEGGLADISLEQVLSWDPDVIILDEGDPRDLANDPQWGQLKAVRNGQVYRLPVGLFIWNRPSVEATAMFPLWLALNAYPDRFESLSMESELARFYDEIFGFRFSADEIQSVLNPAGVQ